MSLDAIEVPMQHYAGQLLIIDQLVVPDSSDELIMGKKENSETKFSDMPRPTFFEPKAIEKTLLNYCSLENVSKQFKDELVDNLFSAVETYMKHLIEKVIAFSVHRSINNLYNDSRCIVRLNMRTSMMFLNDRAVSDFGSSDDESNYGQRRRWKLQRNRTGNSADLEIRLESTNNTALLALGARKPISTPTGTGTGTETKPVAGLTTGVKTVAPTVPQRSFLVRIKLVTVKDIIQFMESEKRYDRSKLLYDAYLTYKL